MTQAKRIRTTRAARKLRPLATERARQSRLPVGGEVFFGGIAYCKVTLLWVVEGKPNLRGYFVGRSGYGFFGPLTHCYPTRAEYDASGVHSK